MKYELNNEYKTIKIYTQCKRSWNNIQPIKFKDLN